MHIRRNDVVKVISGDEAAQGKTGKVLRVLGEGRILVEGINGNAADIIARLRAQSPETLTTEALSLEEIFVATLQPEQHVSPLSVVA